MATRSTPDERRVVLALVVGTLLALGALGYVLWPLIKAAEGRAAESAPPRAPSLTREAELPLNDAGDDLAEAEIRRARAQLRVCPGCGPRPEPAARYCSRCGRALA
ncbi:MAG TPA: hypothetical protein VH638_05320 [Gemmatimonadaceae bacterium]